MGRSELALGQAPGRGVTVLPVVVGLWSAVEGAGFTPLSVSSTSVSWQRARQL